MAPTLPMKPTVSLLGTTALLFEAPGETSLPTQQRIWALAREVQAWPEVGEAVPGMNNLMVTFARGERASPGPARAQREPTGPKRASPAPLDWRTLQNRLRVAWEAAQPLALGGRVVELPVVYGGVGGPHLGDVVAHTRLSVDEIVERHSAPLYPVYALGSHPGYCYLGGMDPTLATPRRKVPVQSIPGGAVSIGGAQTGVSASAGPSGWNTIGSTAMVFFDATRDPPALLQPGDSIRLRVQKVIR